MRPKARSGRRTPHRQRPRKYPGQPPMNLADILGGLLAGGVGGLASGFLGITSGGILVPLLVLLLGKDQHVAQGVSLVVQVVPTSLSGVRNYSRQRSSHHDALADLAGARICGRRLHRRPARLPCFRSRAEMGFCHLSRHSPGHRAVAVGAAQDRGRAQPCLRTCRCIGPCWLRSAPSPAGRRDFSASAAGWPSPRLMAGLTTDLAASFAGHQPRRHGIAGDAAGGVALCAAGHGIAVGRRSSA